MKLSAAVLLSAALGASAHPSGHDHLHRSVQARGDFVVAKKPVAVPTPYAPPPAATPAPSQPASGSGGQYIPFCGASKRATAEQIAYKGNTGAPGQYGCNIMTIPEDIVDKYQYVITFTNKETTDMECKCWPKIGRDGGINGFFTGNEANTFKLPGGGKQSVAFDTNSQGACTCSPGSVPLTSSGQFAATCVEYDFGSLPNKGWSGADASSLVPAAANMPINSLQVCMGDQCSTINAGGTGTNAYVGGTEALDGVGLNIPPGKAHLQCSVGGYN